MTKLAAAMAKATTFRQEEKATNTETVSDSKAAQTAVAQALAVLKDFYAKAADATALLQQPAPEIFDTEHKGMQSENGGGVGMIEVIQTDFARLEADTNAAETSAQKEYDEFMTDSKVDTEQKQKAIEGRSASSRGPPRNCHGACAVVLRLKGRQRQVQSGNSRLRLLPCAFSPIVWGRDGANHCLALHFSLCKLDLKPTGCIGKC